MEKTQKTNQKPAVHAITSAFRAIAFSAALASTAIPSAHSDTLLYVPPNAADTQPSIHKDHHTQHKKDNKNESKVSPKAKVSIGSSEMLKLSADGKKISYTFKDEINIAHVLIATSKDPKSNTIYGFEIYVDFAIDTANLRVFNASAGVDVASGMIFLDKTAKVGDTVTIEISFSKDISATANDSVSMNLYTASARKPMYTTGPIMSFPAGERIDGYQVERLPPEKKKHSIQKPKKNQQQYINPLKEARLD